MYCSCGKCTYIGLMSDDFSIDEKLLSDRRSTYLVRVTGKKNREGFFPGDILVVDRALPFEKDKPALVVRQNKFSVEKVTDSLMKAHDPENADFIWGMIRALVREVP